jgi:hypothetical protein
MKSRIKSNKLMSSVSQELFDSFKRHAEISPAVYASTCPIPPGGINITKQINNRQTDTQGFIARDDAAGEIIVSFRGTSNVRDFQIDLQDDQVPLQSQGVSGCDGCLVHKGFLSAWNSVAAETISAVQAEMATDPNSRVIITGHSLGGSLASLATVSMLGSGMNVTTYTYGQTRTGNKAYADFVDQHAPSGVMLRVTHANDGVPQVFRPQVGISTTRPSTGRRTGQLRRGSLSVRARSRRCVPSDFIPSSSPAPPTYTK